MNRNISTPLLPFNYRADEPRKGRGVAVRSVEELMCRPVPSSEPLVVSGLFAGIGGVELGLARAGHESSLLCEIDPGALAVLEERLPHGKLAKDVRMLKALPRDTQLLAAGFPCQDLSQAGKTRGIRGKESGLIGQVFRLLDRRRLPLVLLENVPFMLQLAKGAALDLIVTEFERMGYKWAYRVVDTRAFGIPQRRQRVLFLASRELDPRDVLLADDAGEPEPRERTPESACGFYWTEGIRGLGWAVDCIPTLKGGSTIGIPSAPAIWMPSGVVGTPDIRDAELLQGFEADWTRPAEKVTRSSFRWKLVGNAVTVNIAHWVGTRLDNPGEYDPSGDLPLSRRSRWPSAAWNLGDGRFISNVSKWPASVPMTPLARFLRFPVKPLSEKATSGFLSRTDRSALRFPHGFLEAVAAHLEAVRGATS